jgi:hypothetical protein
MRNKLGFFVAAILIVPCATFAGTIPTPDHVVMVIEENTNLSTVLTTSYFPYINSLISSGALFTDSYAITHPSQPNYLALFSGSTQGVTGNGTIPNQFTTSSLGGLLIGAGYTFGGYSEDQPSAGYLGDSSGHYVRKHNPWSDFADVPASDNLPFTSFPTDYTQLPTVSIVVPNQLHDFHDQYETGDTWLQTNLGGYVNWAKTHNSLFILTFDEDDNQGGPNKIFTLFAGAGVVAGTYTETINHYSVLRTIEDMYGLTPLGESANVSAVTDAFPAPEPSTAMLGVGWLRQL